MVGKRHTLAALRWKRSRLSTVCVARGLRAVHAYSSLGRMYVQYKYVRTEALRDLRRRRMCFKEVNDLFRIALVCSAQRKSCWKVMTRWRCLRAQSVVVHLSQLLAVVQKACCHGGK